MKKQIILTMLGFVVGMLFSHYVLASGGLTTELSTVAEPVIINERDVLDSLYFGAGLVELKRDAFPVSRTEGSYILNYNGVRSESPRRLGKNIVFGFKSANIPAAFEINYTFDDPGAWAETNASALVYYDYRTGYPVYVPLSVQHTEKYSALTFSVIGEHALNDDVYLVGKVGYTYSQVVSETRTAYACIPACSGYAGDSKTVNDTSITYGVGIKAKVMNRTKGDVWVRLMAEKLPNGMLTSRADVLFPF